MMAKVLMEEMKGTKVRINQVMFGYIHTRTRATHACPEWVTQTRSARFCAYLTSSEALMINAGGILQLSDRPPLV